MLFAHTFVTGRTDRDTVHGKCRVTSYSARRTCDEVPISSTRYALARGSSRRFSTNGVLSGARISANGFVFHKTAKKRSAPEDIRNRGFFWWCESNYTHGSINSSHPRRPLFYQEANATRGD